MSGKESERAQLIQNIILSEIKYADWKAELETAERERAEELQRLIASDEEIISTWMTNYNITFDCVAAERERVLREAQEAKAAAYEKQQQELREQMAMMAMTIEEIPQKKEEEISNIEALITQPCAYE